MLLDQQRGAPLQSNPSWIQGMLGTSPAPWTGQAELCETQGQSLPPLAHQGGAQHDDSDPELLGCHPPQPPTQPEPGSGKRKLSPCPSPHRCPVLFLESPGPWRPDLCLLPYPQLSFYDSVCLELRPPPSVPNRLSPYNPEPQPVVIPSTPGFCLHPRTLPAV